MYIVKIVKYNPKIAILLGIITNGIAILLMIYYTNPVSVIISFCLIYKDYSIYYIIRVIIYINRFYALVVVFIIFLLWRKINTSPNNIGNSIDWIKYKREPGDLTYYLNKAVKKLIK